MQKFAASCVVCLLVPSAFARTLEEIKTSKKLIVAMRSRDLVYKVDETTKKPDMTMLHFQMVNLLAQSLGVQTVTVHVVKEMSEYWANSSNEVLNGQSYTPALFSKVDLYADVLTVLPWREKLANPTPIFPIKEVFLCNFKNDEDILDGIKKQKINVYTVKASSFHSLLTSLGVQEDKIRFTKKSDELTGALKEDKMNACTVRDSDFAFARAKKMNLHFSGLPSSKVEKIAWWTAKNNPELSSVVAEFWKTKLSDGTWAKAFEKAYEMPFDTYVDNMGKL